MAVVAAPSTVVVPRAYGSLKSSRRSVVRRRRRQRLAVQLREVGVENVMRDRRGVGTVDAVLDEDHTGNLWDCRAARRTRTSRGRAGSCRSWRPPSRPGVRNHLGGAGLAADVVARDARATAGAARVDHHPHARREWPGVSQPSHVDLRLRWRGLGSGFQPFPSSMALTRCGVTRVPPLARVAV